jgi:flagellar protein FliT
MNTVLDEVWRLTKEIEQAAAVSEWATAASLASQRAALTRTLTAEQPEGALEIVREIQRIDAQIAQNAAVAQSELTSEYQAAMKSVRNAGKYQQMAQF